MVLSQTDGNGRMQDLIAEFSERYTADPNSGCWLWSRGLQSRGYGSYRRLGEYTAHRVSYRLFVGPIPDGLELDHKCRTKCCVNPKHLEAVTPKENTGRWRATITHCPSGHKFTSENSWLGKTRRGHTHRLCKECLKIAGKKRREIVNLSKPTQETHNVV